MYGKSVAVGALALAGAARAHGLDLDLNLGGSAARDCAENACYGRLLRANAQLDVGGLCVGVLAAVDADLAALSGDLSACARLDVLTAACKCVTHGGTGFGSGSGGAVTMTQAFPVVTMTEGDGMASGTGGGSGMASQTHADDGMASMTASMTAILSASLSSAAAAVTPTASHAEHLTVSTVTTTRWKSVVDCPTSVTDCLVATSHVEVYTTTCPVSGPQVTAPAGGSMPGGGMPGYTFIKTLYSTNWRTVTKCSSTVSQCPATMTSEVQPTGYVTLTYPAVPTLTAVPVPGNGDGAMPGAPGEGYPGNGAMPGAPGEGAQPGNGNGAMPGAPGQGPMPGNPGEGYPTTNGTLPKPPPRHGTGDASPPKPTMPPAAGGPGYGVTPIQTAGARRLAGSGLAVLAAAVVVAPLFL